MESLDTFAIIISVTALFGYINEKSFKLPTTIGVMLVSLLLSLGLLLFGNDSVQNWAKVTLEGLNFNKLVMEGMLSVLLFAGALHVNLDHLRQQRYPILVLASVGVLLSTFIIGSLTYFILPLLGLHLPYIYALVFGALISPTDPIAVLGILKRLGVRKDVETLITGESLFNDGVGVVVFTVIAGLLGAASHGDGHHSSEVNVAAIAQLFAIEALGGLVFGLALGFIGYHLLKSIDNYAIEVTISLAIVIGGYALALQLHTSGPLAMVAAGLLLGNQGRSFAMSDTTRQHLDMFWEMLDEILNAVLFVLIGFELLLVTYSQNLILATFIAIPLVLFARFVCVGTPIQLFRLRSSFPKYTVRTLVWGGLRGGISVALALSLAHGPERDIILAMTYGVVIFSIVVQGLSVGQIAKRIPSASPSP